jgi:hypothetical protein
MSGETCYNLRVGKVFQTAAHSNNGEERTMEILQNETLRVSIQPDEVSARIELLNTDLAWKFQPNVEGDVWVTHGQTQVAAYLREASQKSIRRMSMPDDERLTLFLRGLPGNAALAISFALPKREPVLRVEVESPPTGTPSRVREARFPGAIAWETSQPQHTVWPNAAGMLLPNNYAQAISPNGEGLGGRMGFNRSLYQPWWGVVGDRGAYAAIAETPFDFALDIRHPAGGPTVTRPVWFPSMGHLAYPRAIRYIFFERGDHTTLAKARAMGFVGGEVRPKPSSAETCGQRHFPHKYLQSQLPRHSSDTQRNHLCRARGSDPEPEARTGP